ncbi:O-antigen ligase family protein [Arthrobacter sp. DNA4]|uniref:O-antigen ligase family protein n=1 Tax=Arthrobacter sp. DNA4 TaxID=2963432 RepID=UPI0020CDC27D|nr:O-antigen ligase family protein [Arthrobacter sp. DNA4]UTT69586.1 O-antigen ligase family protein [Arthrobacter sp. DNA4]
MALFLPNITVFILAMARASWIALLVCVVAASVASVVHRYRGSTITVGTGPRRGRWAAVVIAAVAAIVAVAAIPQLQEDVAARASTMLGTVQEDDISGQARIRQNDSLFELARSIPVYGHGLSAAGRVGVWGQINTVGESQNNVASNWVLGMWVDGALFAVPLIIFLIGLALVRVRSLPGQLLLFTLVCSLFSNAVFFPVTWLFVGLAMIAAPGTRKALTRPRHRLEGAPCLSIA